jgi:DNA adenine methylase
LGGKHYLAKQIVPVINGVKHRCYCEPFAGGAHIFFGREPSPAEVLNDLNRDLVTLYRCLQHHFEEFARHFKWSLVSRDEFYRMDRTPPDTLTDIQRAVRFYYLQKLSHSARVWNRSFRTKTEGKPQLNLLRLEEELSAAHLRLARVQIENLPWQECVARYDRPHTLFYLDPPYFGVENYYGKGLFKRAEFTEMAEVLSGLKGQFLMSLNDRPEVREIFRGFHIKPVKTWYPSGSHSPTHDGNAREVLISSFPIRRLTPPMRGAKRRLDAAQTN